MTTATSPASPDLTFFDHARRVDQSQLVDELRDLLGARLVAYLGGVKETRAVRQWAEGTRRIDSAQDRERLRLALQAALLIIQHDTHEVAQAWFQGLNPLLDDQSPARVLREQPYETAGPAVLAAARSFAATG